MGVSQTHGLQGAEGQGVVAAAGQNFHSQTAFEHQLFLEIVHLRQLGGDQRLIEGVVFFPGHGAVQIIRALFISGCPEGPVHVDGLRGDDGRGRIEKVQGGKMRQGGERVGEGGVGERAGGHDAGGVRQRGYQAMLHGNQRMGRQTAGDFLRKFIPIHRQRGSGGHAAFLRRRQNQGIQLFHFRLQKAGAVGQMLRLQGIGAYQFRAGFHVMGGGELQGLHVHEGDGNAPVGQLPGSLAAGQARADHGYGIIRHRCLRDSPPRRGGGRIRWSTRGTGCPSRPASAPYSCRRGDIFR